VKPPFAAYGKLDPINLVRDTLMRAFCLVLLLVGGCSARAPLPAVEDGDVIFQTSRSSQSIAIQHATGSRFSHMGIILARNGHPYVLEASATVRYTPLEKWIEHGVGGHYEVKRLRDAATLLTPEKRGELRRAADSFVGRPYDLTFDWSDERMYCSELVWKIYDRTLGIQIGALQKVRDFNLTDPAVKAKMRERYGPDVPLDAPVISPVAMERSSVLVLVAER
jgi:Permuted papain-like amidase enzyme, YaeF/YiiX, C92 family